jgi:hypothetical protein
MALRQLFVVSFGVIFGIAVGFLASVWVGLPPLAMMGLGAGIGGAYMAAAGS